MKRRLFFAAIGLLLVMFAGRTFADSYNVSASVPFDVPTQAATISPSLQNTNTTTADVVISGTCQVLNPVTVVSVWRDTTLLGSAVCQVGGTYSLHVLLQAQINHLIAKTANISNVYGPDSTVTTMTYIPPETPAPPVTPATPALTIVQKQANIAVASDLQIHTAEPFTVLPSSNTVTVSVLISGGTTPYTVTLNWGDGATDTRTITQAGSYEFTHTYAKANNYAVKAKVRDVLGAETEYNFAVVSPTPETRSLAAPKQAPSSKPAHKYSIDARALLVGVPVVSLITFFVGRSYQLHVLAPHTAKKIPKKRKK